MVPVKTSCISYSARKTFFLISLLVCIVGWLTVSYSIYHFRQGVPVELDDSYSYLVKASEMKECFLQKSIALTDLKKQVFRGAGDDNYQDLVRSRIVHRLFSVYHPLYSGLLVLLETLGLTWEGSYWVLFFVGKIFIALAISYWLYALVGPKNAGGTLLLLTFSSFSGHGLLSIVPSNLALGIAMILWGMIARTPYEMKKRCLLLVILMEAMHPLGRLYAFAGLCALVFSSGGKELSLHKKFLFIYTFLIGVPFLLPFIIGHPFLGIITEPPPEGWTFFIGLQNEITSAIVILNHWLNNGSPLTWISLIVYLLTLIIVFMGGKALSDERKKNFIVIFLPLSGLILVQFFKINPHYPGVLFERTLIPFAILCYALIVSFFFQLMELSFPSLATHEKIVEGKTSFLFLLLLCSTLIIFHQYQQLQRLYSSAKTMVTRHMLRPDLEQITSLKNSLSDNDSVVLYYLGEIPLYIYLTNDFWNYRTVSLDAILGSTLDKEWISMCKNKSSYLIALSPLFNLKKLAYFNGIRLNPKEYIDFVHPDGKFNFNEFTIESKKGVKSLTLYRIDIGDHLTHDDILLNEDGTIFQPTRYIGTTKGVRLVNESGEIQYIDAFRSETQLDRGLHWPWDSGLVLKSCYSQSAGENYSTQFTSDYLEKVGLQARILNDVGATVLFRLSGNDDIDNK